MVAVKISISASDNCDPAPVSRIVWITCNEQTSPGDIQITGDLTANLAASRDPAGNGRVYTITVATTDASGNRYTRPSASRRVICGAAAACGASNQAGLGLM